jgi:LuxR family maltose regulon positive regulatory protein
VILAAKLRAPGLRRDLVPRPALVEHVAAGTAQRLTLLAAPAGWGKTTLLAAWQHHERGARRFAWLSVDPWDNDPVRFWTYVVEAIRTVEPLVGADALALLQARGTRLVENVLPALVNDLEPLGERVVLVLDDYHLIENEEIHEALVFLLDHLPRSLHLVIATRFDPPLPIARMRARGELLEIRAQELRFSPEESASFLNEVLGLGLEHEDVLRLHERTEGWAAGLYLAVLSLRGRPDPRPFIAAFAGDDRHVVDYLAAEVLRGQSEDVRTFMLRTSVLDRLSGPLCDVLTGKLGSAAMLRRIERANLFLVPLDNRRRWYRYHHLFGSLLFHELEQTEPDLIAELHRRASSWYREAGFIPDAIRHAIAAGEVDEARELIAEHWNAFFNQGRLATVAGWLDALPGDAVAGDSRLSVARAWLALDRGLLEEVEAWIDASSEGVSPEGHMETAVLRAVHRFKSGDVGQANEAARKVLELAPPEAVFPRTAAGCVLGATHYWSGESARAVEALGEAAHLARSAKNDLAASYALGYLAVVAADRGDLKAADAFASQALQQSDEPGFEEHFVTMMAHLGRAKTRLREGNIGKAERAASRSLALGLRGAGRIEIASALLTLAEVKQVQGAAAEGEALVREARELISNCPDPRMLAESASRRATPRDPSEGELTDRELAVLRLLDTDLSQREIGATLYVSLNTVKTHTRGIFRKLRVSNRREAVERARALGLLALR